MISYIKLVEIFALSQTFWSLIYLRNNLTIHCNLVEYID